MTKINQILFLLIVMVGCFQSEDYTSGNYVLQNSTTENIAEILELNSDSTFVFSGLENDNSYLLTWAIEGIWKIQGDKILLNSVGQNNVKKTPKVNLEYLGSYIDSVEYLDQAMKVCRNLPLIIRNNKLLRIVDGKELIYKKNEHSR